MKCRICSSCDLIDVIKLGKQYITSKFPKKDEIVSKSDVTLCMCNNCNLVQMKETTSFKDMYETSEYGYRSGINESMIKHLHEYHKEILSKVELETGDVIVDIGSNDSTMLQNYSNVYIRVGIDPTGKQFKHFYNEVELIPEYFTKDIYTYKKAKIVSSISMFYDLEDPVKFAQDVYDILDENGIWTCEQSYLPFMIRKNSIDTICHEHLEYYGLKQIKYIADKVGFNIIDVVFNECNGGSFRVYFSKNKKQCDISKILKEEELIFRKETFEEFIKNVDVEIKKLKKFIKGKNVYIYGASTKGNCLLQYANIGKESINYAVERNIEKIGKFTSTGIEIISEDLMRKNSPDYLLVLPWHFENHILHREEEFLKNGGQIIFPFPNFKIVTKRKKVLITGSKGQIAHYVKELFSKEYSIYNDDDIDIVNPDIVIHLAGISNSKEAFSNVIPTLETNGMMVAKICDYIHRNNLNIKLFNASSSYMFNGHENYNVHENDTHMYHLHPYSIAKTMGHNIVNFYRKTYNLPFSNGILFTIESEHRKNDFLIKKLSNHAKEWKYTKNKLVLNGNLNSYRNVLHAYDAASAIKIIIEQDHGDDYLICNVKSKKMYDIAKNIYKEHGIDIDVEDLFIFGNDVDSCDIRGYPEKLLKLGWKPTKEY